MATHWFYSFGTSPRETTYVLPDGRPETARFVLVALLRAGWPRGAAGVAFHPLTTRELDQGTGAETPRQVFERDLPAGHEHVTAGWGAFPVDDRDLWAVVHGVLSRVNDGDEVLIELTNGMRHVTLGLMLAAGLVQSLRRDVRVVAVTYGELDGRAPIQDLAPLLETFAWAQAAKALGRSLDPGPLAELLREPVGRLKRAAYEGRVERQHADALGAVLATLIDLTPALGLGYPRDVSAGLQRLAQTLSLVDEAADRTVAGRGVLAGHALRHAARTLAPLAEVAAAERLDDDRLRFDLALVRALRDAGRHADAIRLAREWIVNREVLVNGDATRWLARKERENAEARLWGRAPDDVVLRLWKRIGAVRNATSHCGLNESAPRLKAYDDVLTDALDQLPNLSFATVSEPPQRRCWLANAFSLNMLGSIPKGLAVRVEEASLDEVRGLDMQSCIGHEDTARILTGLLGRPVEANRDTVKLELGDELIVAQYDGARLPVGATTLPEGSTFRWFRVAVRE